MSSESPAKKPRLDHPNDLGSKLQSLSSSIDCVDSTLLSVNLQAQEAEASIQRTFQQLIFLVSQRQKMLSFEVEQAKKQKEAKLLHQKESLLRLRESIDAAMRMMEGSHMENNHNNHLGKHQQQQEQQLTLSLDDWLLEYEEVRQPVADALILLEGGDQALAEGGRLIQRLGFVVTKEVCVERSLAFLQSPSSTPPVIHQACVVSIVLSDIKGDRVATNHRKAGALFDVSVAGPTILKTTLVETSETWLLSFTPNLPGNYEISITSNSKHLKGSPVIVRVLEQAYGPYTRDYTLVSDKPMARFGVRGIEQGQIRRPGSVACNGRGDIIVIEPYTHRCQAFTRDGEFLYAIGTQGTGPGQLRGPRGVTVDRRNNQVVIADSENHRIQIFDEHGVFLRQFGTRGVGPGQLSYPASVTVDKHGSYFVGDFINNRVQVFNSEGEFVRFFGSEGDGGGQFRNPCGIGIFANEDVVVVSSDAIQVFDPKGNFLYRFAHGEISCGFHAFVDNSDVILLADWGNKRIRIYHKDSRHLRDLGLGYLSYPTGVAVDPEGRIVVSESSSHKISIF